MDHERSSTMLFTKDIEKSLIPKLRVIGVLGATSHNVFPWFMADMVVR
jgi:hypothetical protein